MTEELESKIKAAKDKLESSKKIEPPASATGTKIVIDLISGLGVGAFLGYFIDVQLNTLPLFLFICMVLGVAGGFYNFYKDYIKSLDKNKDENKEDA